MSPLFLCNEVHRSKETCHRAVKTSLWSIRYSGEICIYCQDFPDDDHLKCVLLFYTAGPIS